MTKVQRSQDCGNSPKNQLLQELTVAIARSDKAKLLGFLAVDVQWSLVGKKSISGAEAVCKALMHSGKATALTIEHVISHGRSGAVDGVVVFGDKKRAFCHVYEFGSARGVNVSGITTYSIAIE
jgi:hypothetical protein